MTEKREERAKLYLVSGPYGREDSRFSNDLRLIKERWREPEKMGNKYEDIKYMTLNMKDFKR